jgi:hypothetical protein
MISILYDLFKFITLNSKLKILKYLKYGIVAYGKFEEKVGLTLKVKNTLHSKNTPYQEAPSLCQTLSRNGLNEAPFHRTELPLSECLL